MDKELSYIKLNFGDNDWVKVGVHGDIDYIKDFGNNYINFEKTYKYVDGINMIKYNIVLDLEESGKKIIDLVKFYDKEDNEINLYLDIMVLLSSVDFEDNSMYNVKSYELCNIYLKKLFDSNIKLCIDCK